jgi:hypothetical protein
VPWSDATDAGDIDNEPMVCVTHLRFVPCRKAGEHTYSSLPEDIKRVAEHHRQPPIQ